jgi:gas vesicle protein
MINQKLINNAGLKFDSLEVINDEDLYKYNNRFYEEKLNYIDKVISVLSNETDIETNNFKRLLAITITLKSLSTELIRDIDNLKEQHENEIDELKSQVKNIKETLNRYNF